MTDGAELLRARFGIDLPGVDVPAEIAPLLDRRVTRRYTDQPVPDSLLDALLAAAQSAPTKSDLQQYSVVVMRDRARIKQIADWIGTMDWIATAPVFLVWCGDMRRNQRLCEQHGMPHANNNLDTFLNTAVDCTLAMGAVHRRRRGDRSRHLPDQLCAQPHRARHAAAVAAARRLSGRRPLGRLAGVPPPGVDAPAAVGRRASRALRRDAPGRRDPRLRRTPRARANRWPPAPEEQRRLSARARASAGARTSPASSRCRSASASPPTSRREDSILPEDHVRHAPLIDQQSPPRPRAVRPRHAASLIVYRERRRRRCRC